MKYFIMSLIFALFSYSTYAHEGHNKTPGQLTAPHGGQIKGTTHLYIELVSDKSGFKLYTFDHDLKPVSLSEIKIEGSVKRPKQKNSEKLELKTNENFLETKVDAKGLHRYSVDLKVTHMGKTETVSYNVEPQD